MELGKSIFARPSVISENPGGGSLFFSSSWDMLVPLELLAHVYPHISRIFVAENLHSGRFVVENLQKGKIFATALLLLHHMGGSVI